MKRLFLPLLLMVSGLKAEEVEVFGRLKLIGNRNSSDVLSSETVATVESGDLVTPADIFISGDYAYIPDGGQEKTHIYNIADPLSPTYVTFFTDYVSGNATSIYVSGNYALIGYDSKVIIVDVSNPEIPTLVSTITSGLSGATAVYVKDSYAYIISNGNNSLVIFDISDPAYPTLVSSTDSSLDLPIAADIADNYIYIASSGNDSLVILDVSDPSLPVVVATISSNLSSPQAVKVANGYAYVTSQGNNSLVIFDVLTPSSPIFVSSTGDGISLPKAIYINYKYTYVANLGDNSIAMIDVSDPYAPFLAIPIYTGNNPAAMAFHKFDRYILNINKDDGSLFVTKLFFNPETEALNIDGTVLVNPVYGKGIEIVSSGNSQGTLATIDASLMKGDKALDIKGPIEGEALTVEGISTFNGSTAPTHTVTITSPEGTTESYGLNIEGPENSYGLHVVGESSIRGDNLGSGKTTLTVYPPMGDGFTLAVPGQSWFEASNFVNGINLFNSGPISISDSSDHMAPFEALVRIYGGTYDPNGNLTAPQGSLYLRSNGTAYINRDGESLWSALAFA